MTNLKQLDEKLTALDIDLKSMVNEIQFKEIGIYTYEDFVSQDLNFNEFNFKGLYMFEIRNNGNFEDIQDWKIDFITKWNDDDFFVKSVPKIIKERIKNLNKYEEWIPLYIGKSQTVGSRIKEHIYLTFNKTTSALKLNARHNLKGETFRISVAEINVNNYNWIVPVLENELRKKLNPIVGKQ
ncbi:hypothetical protein [Faecalibacter sp. LW9]|uniref:hypothetical protein n=1 Tax=Faecalibacter sp. LW9 TaxID=3103144 RepID=UPI002AFF0989|nr:hypothetical protein [Faecalibacter sp. LW9]